ncbi:MAG TPA: cytochrome P450 [Candidatus Sumerlaeota bacterium]|nr:cytochrome P450 [Candidatus Sumerlaeota bacterium]HOR27118.1 cytochrome P450 [Candidatus Sumerlaeota bacterium]HPK01193.1 cytochrome P450 [Candidatus Sumerlaeota bacterium]
MNSPHACPDPQLDALLVSDEIMEDPYPIYERLREEQPVFWSDAWQAWVISRYDDVEASLKDKDNLSNENRQALLFSALTEAERAEVAPLRHYYAQKDVIGSDPPDHSRMRALVQKAFTPKTVAGLGPRIEALAHELLDHALQSRRFDFIAEVAHPLPVILIAEMMGAPVKDRHLFKRWSADILAFQGTGVTTADAARISQASLLEMFDYMNELIDSRRVEPRDDLITALANAEEEGQRFSRDELLATCNTILTAGHETTTNLLGNLLHLLLRHRDQWTALVRDPNLITPAIEEALRYDAPKQRNFRRVKRAHEFLGVPFAEDEMVFQLIGSAQRDPRHYDQPDVFNIQRGKIEHLAFGAGIHFCLGAPLARLEARKVLEIMLARCPDVELEPETVKWQPRVQFRGPGEMWIRRGA